MIQKGLFWQVSMPRTASGRLLRVELPAADGMKIRRSSPGSAFEQRLWESGVRVAWIGETGRRLTDIAERALVCRWAGVAGDEVEVQKRRV